MREHVDDARNGKRLARVDARDATLGDRGGNDAGMREPGRIDRFTLPTAAPIPIR
jgi:hypothetical protein